MSDPWANGRLDRDNPVHQRLVDDPHYHQLAGIPRASLWAPLSEVCSAGEIELLAAVRRWADNGSAGMLYLGAWPDPLARFRAITGGLVRGEVDARLRTLRQLREAQDEAASCSVLVIPNLSLADAPDKITRQVVGDLLVSRAMRAKPTIAAVESLEQIRLAYGATPAQYLRDNYTVLMGGS